MNLFISVYHFPQKFQFGTMMVQAPTKQKAVTVICTCNLRLCSGIHSEGEITNLCYVMSTNMIRDQQVRPLMKYSHHASSECDMCTGALLEKSSRFSFPHLGLGLGLGCWTRTKQEQENICIHKDKAITYCLMHAWWCN